ncbi:MAG: universal stress protein [Chloroflexi bacterium]|nr:universal stress protein [Chloroflexota bacterium]
MSPEKQGSRITSGDERTLQAVEENDCDLIVVGTHGKAGLDAFWAGCVGAKISPLTAIPLLLVPVEKAG